MYEAVSEEMFENFDDTDDNNNDDDSNNNGRQSMDILQAHL